MKNKHTQKKKNCVVSPDAIGKKLEESIKNPSSTYYTPPDALKESRREVAHQKLKAALKAVREFVDAEIEFSMKGDRVMPALAHSSISRALMMMEVEAVKRIDSLVDAELAKRKKIQ